MAYQYYENTRRVWQQVNSKSATDQLKTIREYDKLGRIVQVGHERQGANAGIAAQYSYAYNLAGQRERINLHDGTHWVYEYDSLGQVTAGRRRLADETTVVNGLDFGYTYDDIGNRLAATRGAREWPYTPNALNQYDERTVPGAIDALGTAHEDAIVTVNDEETTRQGDWWYRELEVDNDPDAVWRDIEVVGVRPEAGPDGKDVVTIAERQAFVPGTPEAFTHDLDGNLLSDGRWTYSWDAENRLQSVTGIHCGAGVPACPICNETPTQVKINYTYDERWRRVARELRAWDAVGEAWGPVLQRTRYLYDGWNVLAELDDADLITARYTWGLDLAEQVSGGAVAATGPARAAGGIGGLLLAEIALPADLASPPGAGPGLHSFSAVGWTGADANGNTILWSSTGTTAHAADAVLASYAYDPFGNPLAEGSTLHSFSGAEPLPYTFSTKPHDPLTTHAYYGYRWYTADTGRWLSRDPIGDTAFLTSILEGDDRTAYFGKMIKESLYNFIMNVPNSFVDYHGLTKIGTILDSFFAFTNLSPDIYVMDEDDEYTTIVRNWTAVKDNIMLLKQSVSSNPE